jgi:hypothetical protein
MLKENKVIKEHFMSENISMDSVTYNQLTSSIACLYIYLQDTRYTLLDETPLRLPIDLWVLIFLNFIDLLCV